MRHMFRAIRRVLDEHPECKAIYPHINAVVRKVANEELGDCSLHIKTVWNRRGDNIS